MAHVVNLLNSDGQFVILGKSLTLPVSSASNTDALAGSLRYNPGNSAVEAYLSVSGNPPGWIAIPVGDGATISQPIGAVRLNASSGNLEAYENQNGTPAWTLLLAGQIGAISASLLAASFGVATLDANGLHEPSQIPALLNSSITGNAASATRLQVAHSVALAGDVSGTVPFDGGTDSTMTATLAATGVTAGTYSQVVVNEKGLVVDAANPPLISDTAEKLFTARAIAIAGDATGSANFDGSANTTITATLAASGVAAGTYSQVVVNSKGLVTGAANPAVAASTASKLATPRTIAVSGDVTGATSFDGSANVTLAAALATSGVVAGTYSQVVVNNKGLVISAGNPAVVATTADALTTPRLIALSGDATGSVSFDGSTNATIAASLAASGVVAGTYSQVVVNSKGLVVAASASGATKLATAQRIALAGDATGFALFDGSSAATITASLAATGVTAGTYSIATIVVDSKGRIAYAAAGSGTAAPTGFDNVYAGSMTTNATGLQNFTGIGANGYVTLPTSSLTLLSGLWYIDVVGVRADNTIAASLAYETLVGWTSSGGSTAVGLTNAINLKRNGSSEQTQINVVGNADTTVLVQINPPDAGTWYWRIVVRANYVTH